MDFSLKRKSSGEKRLACLVSRTTGNLVRELCDFAVDQDLRRLRSAFPDNHESGCLCAFITGDIAVLYFLACVAGSFSWPVC